MASQPYLGAIFMFGGNFAPRGYALCQGQLLSISSNAALFAILGTTFGGNGTSTFGLPDLRSRVPVGVGQGAGLSNYVLGEQTGVENVTLLSNNMPEHTHLVSVVSGPGNQASPTGNYPAAGALAITHPVPDFPGLTPDNYSNGTPNATMNAATLSIAGGNVPHNNIQPVLTVTYIIATVGIFPTRN
jgi:microcystin-dependent protein